MFAFGACGKHPGGPFGFGQHPFAQFIQQRMHGHGGGDCGGPGAVLNELNLTDEQLERVAELKLAALGDCAQLKAKVGDLLKTFAKELTQEPIDKTKVNNIAQQIKAEKSKLGDAMIERILAFAEVLTPEQRRKLRSSAIRRFLGVDLSAQGEI
jgi:Spy/CpxP family protein refolding chaperone